MFFRLLSIGAVLVALTGCGTSSNMANAPEIRVNMELFKTMKSELNVRQYLAGFTAISHSSGHGTQVEYTDKAGRVLLWYPNNRTVVTGQWTTRSGARGAELCFKYQTNSVNPVTRQKGGQWECSLAALSLINDIERLSGDPFGLATGQIPFVMPPAVFLRAADLAERSGVSVSALRYKPAMRLQ